MKGEIKNPKNTVEYTIQKHDDRHDSFNQLCILIMMIQFSK